MNPTNESIGRAFREAEAGSFVHTTQAGLFRLILDRARELDRQAPGEWGGYEAFEQFLAAEIDSAPEALRRLGEWLGNVLDEDHFATANRLVLGAMLETSDAIRKVAASKAAPQPPAQEQGEVGEHVLMLDMILTSYGEKPLTFTAEKAALKAAIASLTRAAGAEDARDVTWPATLKEQGSYREVVHGTMKWNGVPCFVTGRVWTHNNNWPLIDAAIASQAKEGEK